MIFDGSFEWASRTGEVTLDPNSQLVNNEYVNNLNIMSNQVPVDGTVHIVNDNNGLYFNLGKYPGNGVNRWVVKNHLVNKNVNLLNETKYAFISSKHTGVITLSINTLSKENELNAYDPIKRQHFFLGLFITKIYL